MGYIDYENLNQELKDLIGQGGGGSQSNVVSVNNRLPDANGNINTKFIFLDNGDVEAPVTDFPEGMSTFLTPNIEVLNVVGQSGMTIPPMLMSRDTSSMMKVTTFKDSTKGVYTQEFQAAVDGIYETRYYRNGNGTNWEQLQEHRIIRSIDGQQADENGNVITSFRTIDAVRLDVPPSAFDKGVSEYYDTFLVSDYTDYIADNPSLSMLEDGSRIAVRTHVYPGITTYQEIDNIQDFVFAGQYFRVAITDNEDKWGPLMKRGNGAVTEINGIRPDQSGSITLPTASTTTVGLVKPDGITITASADGTLTALGGGGGGTTTPLSDNYQLADSATAASTKATKDLYDALNTAISDLDTNTQDITQNITNLETSVNNVTQLINEANTALTNHEGKIATETEYGHVKLHNGLMHTADDGSALDARQGLFLNAQLRALTGNVDNFRGELSSHVQTKASTTELGHVKIDGSTITIDDDGVIRANAGGTVTPTIVEDVLNSNSTTNALSANRGRELKTQLDIHADNADIHMTADEKAKLASIEEGATKTEVDGTSIIVNGDGKLEAVAPLPTWGNF